ncbi:MAG: potassium channel family protein [Acidimicrobiales bacterium]
MHPYMTPGLERWRERTDAWLLALAIGSLPILLLEIRNDSLAPGDQFFIRMLNIVVFVAFLLDYFVELALAADRGRYMRSEWLSLFIVVAQGVAIAPKLGLFFGPLRILRVGRVWPSVVLFGRALAIGAAAKDGRQLLRRQPALLAVRVAGLTWISSAVAYSFAENVGLQGDVGKTRSFFDALWWSATTIATVGYGDIAPMTVAGRLVAMVNMVVGIGAFAVVTGKFAEFLVRSDLEDADGAGLPPDRT